MAISCLNDLAGIGSLCNPKNNFGVMSALFLQSPDDTFASASDIATEATWLGKIRDKLIFPIHGIQAIEDARVEDGIFTGNLGDKIKQYDGKKGYRVGLILDLESHKALKTYSGKNWRLIKGDVNNNFRFTESDTGVYRGFKLSYFDVSDQYEPIGADSPAITWVDIQEADTNEWSVYGAYLSNPTFLVSELTGVNTVVMTQVGTVATNKGTFDVAYVDDSMLNGQSSGADTSYAITGLVAANFQIRLAADSSVDTPATLVTPDANIPGRYEVTFTAFVATDEIKVIPSTTQLHESDYLTVS